MSRTHQDHCTELEAELHRFAAVAASADPAAQVPTCPGWTVAKLLKHVGIAHRWAEHMVRNRSAEPVPPRQVPAGVPGDPADYPRWIADGGAALVDTLRTAPLDAPIWSWGGGHGAAFWSRRMLFETAVHRADAEFALGAEPRVEAAVAADGVDEFLGNLAAAGRSFTALADLDDTGTLHFHATDTDGGEWMVTAEPGGMSWTHGHGKGDVAVRGTASDLLLLLYGRVRPGDPRYQVFGDTGLLGRWLSKTSF
ncbi:maleylpyruvate isomerase family mycothiol-dependent enzyme [Sphaerisporangium rubeum]|uniref:Uncharacterized protein (TIGR03083 family) n=1 Tax=Sphaerisporangium rubeum TaxID=321317 RepID=A0A7X0IIT7_9ACTN|nr:maleylpyruvate isomerase family mycothiol-dependent enzyme [Sphaerisporangium rubeum]MBB6475434.1 uncharacterized protein (TIGR03083 family) [Sphaerisporangium rubeum]